MRKIPITIAFLLAFTFSSNAQDITFGIKGGVDYIKIGKLFHNPSNGETGVIPLDDFYYSSTNELGYSFGAYFRINMNQFYVQPEVNFVSLNSSYELGKETSNWTQSSVDIPILFGYRVYYPVAVYAGPIFSMISDRQLEGVEIKAATPWTFEKSMTSISAGINVSINRFTLDFRYSYSITKAEYVKIDMDRAKYGTNIGALVEHNPSRYSFQLQIDVFNFGGEKKSRGSKSNWRNHKNL